MTVRSRASVPGLSGSRDAHRHPALLQLAVESVFGWNVAENKPHGTYWLFRSGNVEGAFNGRTKPAPGSVVLILAVDDMPAALARIKENGGRVIRDRHPIEDDSAGYDAYFLDPNGNELGVYSAK